MKELLQDFANKPLDTMSDEDIGNLINSMKDKVLASANPYLMELLVGSEADSGQPQDQMEIETEQN